MYWLLALCSLFNPVRTAFMDLTRIHVRLTICWSLFLVFLFYLFVTDYAHDIRCCPYYVVCVIFYEAEYSSRNLFTLSCVLCYYTLYTICCVCVYTAGGWNALLYFSGTLWRQAISSHLCDTKLDKYQISLINKLSTLTIIPSALLLYCSCLAVDAVKT